MAFSSFCKQMLQEAMQDLGHLISAVAAIGGCLATGRSSLALAGLWCRQNHEHDIHPYAACLDHTSGSTHRSQNPAGQVIAAQVGSVCMCHSQRSCRCRAEWDSQEGRHFTIDIATRNPASRPSLQSI